MVRYVIWGAGAVGGALGAALHLAGRDVLLVVRGRHRDSILADGLRWELPDASHTVRVPATEQPDALRGEDVVLITVKSQDTLAALEPIEGMADPDIPVVCVQNGVENERLALRRFARVYGVSAQLPAEHLEPGLVRLYADPADVVLDVGRYPRGVDDAARAIVSDLSAAGFRARTAENVMAIKHQKLLGNLENAAQALCGTDDPDVPMLVAEARREALSCFAAAAIEVTNDEELTRRASGAIPFRKISGERRQGGSTWQSMSRRTGRVETDYLAGEIVLLGRLHAVPTPVNAVLQRETTRQARLRATPGGTPAMQLLVAARRGSTARGL
jgi:2-dehydropantoate 2-reductase